MLDRQLSVCQHSLRWAARTSIQVSRHGSTESDGSQGRTRHITMGSAGLFRQYGEGASRLVPRPAHLCVTRSVGDIPPRSAVGFTRRALQSLAVLHGDLPTPV